MKSPADMKIIQIDITNACPKRCANCTRFCGHHVEPFFMDFETFKKAVDSLKGFRGIVGIMGGEPTVHPEFERFVGYLKESVGFEDFSTALHQPTGDFMRHILANANHVDYSNHRGLFTSVTPRYYEHFELIQDTFGYQLLNDHSNLSLHQTHMITRKELGIPDSEWIKLRDRCWVQNLWSASITPKGAFFCEIAAAMDTTLGGSGGWPIEPGWWKRTTSDFGDQLNWCEMCSACLPMPSRDARDETDDVSPIWAMKLADINSPKLRKGLVNTLDVKTLANAKHSIISECTPYLDDDETRLGKTRGRLVPQEIKYISLLTGRLTEELARALLTKLKAENHLDAVVARDSSLLTLADEIGVPVVPEDDGLKALIKAVRAKDWVLLMEDSIPSDLLFGLIEQCVFNPGVLYRRDEPNASALFFNVRARALRNGGSLINLQSHFPARKVAILKATSKDELTLSETAVFWRRILKRVTWWRRKIAGLPVTRGPLGAWKGNSVVE
jgi:hypothetical protein